MKTFFATRRHERGADDKAAVGVDGKGRRQPRPLQSCARLLELLRPSHRELAQPRMVTSFFLQGILFVAHHVRCGGYFISEHPAPPRTPRGFQHGYRHGLPCCGATRTSVCMWFPNLALQSQSRPTGFFLNSPCNHADATARKCSAVYIGRNSDGFKTSCPKEYPERFNAQDLRVPLQIGWSSSFDRVE